MAVTDQQKLDFLLKKIGYTKTKTGSVVGTGAISGTGKQPFAEAIPSPLVVPNSSLWNEAASIPATAPGSDTTQVKVYLAGTSGLRMTADSTSSGQRAYIAYTTYNDTSSARLTNWIDTQFGASYLIKVYKGDPNSGGVALSAAGSGSNDGWFFDYSAGVLNFNDTSVPSGVTDTNIYIVGYRYIGQTGAPTSGISTFSYIDLTVERNLDVGVQGGISTFRNNIDLNADLDVDGHTNLDNLNVAGVTTFAGATTHSGGATVNTHLDVIGLTTLDDVNVSSGATFAGAIDANGDLDVDGHTNLDNVSVAGVSTFTGDATFSGSVSIGGTLTYEDVTNIDSVGLLTARSGIRVTGGVIEAQAGENKIPSLYSAMGNLPSAGSYHGMFAHVHATGRGYFAHAGNWLELVNREINGVVGTGTETYTIGNLVSTSSTATSLNVTGVTTAVTVDVNGDLDVDGHTNLDNVSVAGVTTFAANTRFNSTITAGGATGTNGQYLKTTGSGVEWATFPSLRTRSTFTASSGQTTFSFNYTVNFLDVFVNGVKLTDSEFTATNGSSVVLAVGSFVGDIVELVSYNTVSAGGGAIMGNVVEDTSPQLGGNLDLFSKTINGTGGIHITGVVTATTFVGDGSGLTGIVASGSGVVVKHDGSTVGTAGTINFGSNLDVTPISSGIVTVTAAAGGGSTAEVRANTLSVIGISTFTGNIDANGDLDVDGHTNLDNVSVAGVVTATTFVGALTGNATGLSGNPSINLTDLDVDGHTNLDNVSIAGVVTATTFKGAIEATSASFSSNIDANGDLDVDGHTNLDNVNIAGITTINGGKLAIGNVVPSKMLELYSSSTVSSMYESAGASYVEAQFKNSARHYIVGLRPDQSSAFCILDNTSGSGGVLLKASGHTVTLDHDLNVDGHTNLDNVSIAGVTTFAGAIDLNADLDVDGHTNLDNVSVAGVSTFANTVDFTNGTLKRSSTGNQLVFYADNETRFYHTSNALVKLTLYGTGEALRGSIEGNASQIQIKDSGGRSGLLIAHGAESRLYFNDVEKFRTTNTGAVVSGILTATSFSGDGSGLTGITASGSGVVIKHDGSTVGTAGTINFSTNLDVSAISAGIVTVTASGGGGGVSLSGSTNNTVATVTGANALIGEANLTFDGSTLAVGGSTNEKLILSGSSNPYIQFQEGTTNKAYIQWSAGSGYLQLGNEEAGEVLRLADGESGLIWRVGTSNRTVWTSGNDGASSGLDADLLDGQQGSYYSPNVGISTNLSGSFTASAGSPSTINTFGYGSGDIVVEYTVFIKNGSNYQSQKLLAMRDGTTVHSTQFAIMYSSSLLVQLDATISSGNILLRATPETGVSGDTTYKIKREVM